MTAGRASSSSRVAARCPACRRSSFPFGPDFDPGSRPGFFFVRTTKNRSQPIGTPVGCGHWHGAGQSPLPPEEAEGLPNERCGKTASVIATDHAVERGAAGRRGRVIDGHNAFQASGPAGVGGQTPAGYARGAPPGQGRRADVNRLSRRSGDADRSWAGRYRPRPGSCGSAACSIRYARG